MCGEKKTANIPSETTKKSLGPSILLGERLEDTNPYLKSTGVVSAFLPEPL